VSADSSVTLYGSYRPNLQKFAEFDYEILEITREDVVGKGRRL